jgi:nitrogen regulatory protein PII
VLTARSAGSAWVRATSEGRVGRAEVHVVAAAPAPAVAALDPAVLVVGTAGPVTLRVLGTGFTAGTTLRWNGAERATTVVSATELRVAVPTEDLRSRRPSC